MILLRDAPLEVLMLRRLSNASFVPDLWVFPGGVADESDFEGTTNTVDAMRVTAARELFEEAGVWLGGAPPSDMQRKLLLERQTSFRDLGTADLDSLVLTSHWITPVGVPKRFDTYFFLAKVDRAVVATHHEQEAAEMLWITPADALAKLDIIFPTRKNLEALTGYATAVGLIDSRRGADIPVIQPIIVDKKIRLP